MDVIDLVKLGEDYLEQGDINNARSKFLEAAVLAPEDPQLHNRLGMLEMSQGNYETAQKYYTKACELAPEVSRYHMRLGDSFQRFRNLYELYVDDLIDGLTLLMNSENIITGPINLGNPDEFQIFELAQIIIELTKSKSKISYLSLPGDDPKQRQPNISLAKEKLGWEPSLKLKKGLIKTIEYFKKVL